VRLGAILMFFDIFLDFYLFGVFSMRKCVRIWIFSMRKIPALMISMKSWVSGCQSLESLKFSSDSRPYAWEIVFPIFPRF
jgi:hypothetical protein